MNACNVIYLTVVLKGYQPKHRKINPICKFNLDLDPGMVTLSAISEANFSYVSNFNEFETLNYIFRCIYDMKNIFLKRIQDNRKMHLGISYHQTGNSYLDHVA